MPEDQRQAVGTWMAATSLDMGVGNTTTTAGCRVMTARATQCQRHRPWYRGARSSHVQGSDGGEVEFVEGSARAGNSKPDSLRAEGWRPFARQVVARLCRQLALRRPRCCACMLQSELHPNAYLSVSLRIVRVFFFNAFYTRIIRYYARTSRILQGHWSPATRRTPSHSASHP